MRLPVTAMCLAATAQVAERKGGAGGGGSLKGGLTRAFQGVSPGLVADLAEGAGAPQTRDLLHTAVTCYQM